MIRRTISVVAAGALALGGLATAGAAAASPASPASTPRFAHAPGAAGLIGTTVRPAAADANRQVKVIFQLSGDSVARHSAAAKRQGRSLSAADRASLRAQLKSQQQAIPPSTRRPVSRAIWS